MAYLRWSYSPWYAYRHVDGGEGHEAVLLARHETGFDLWATAAELDEARQDGSDETGCWLRRLIAARPGHTDAALADAPELVPAVDEFLRAALLAGQVPMPADIARRYRVLRWLVRRRVNRPLAPDRYRQAVTSPEDGEPIEVALARLRRQHPEWAWIAELQELDRRYPPPPMAKEIRALLRERGLRAMAGEEVSARQDRLERARIQAASQAWPPVAAGRRRRSPEPASNPTGSKS